MSFPDTAITSYSLKGRPEYRNFPLLLFSNTQGDGSDHKHSHDFIEIALVRSGYTSHCIYDEAQGTRYNSSLIHGDLYIIAPGTSHQFRNKKNLLLYTMAFLPELFSAEELALLKSLAPLKDILGPQKLPPNRLHLLPLEFSRMEQLLQRLMRELVYCGEPGIHRLLAKTLALEYLISIGMHEPECWSFPVRNTDENILKSLEDMEHNPMQAWSLKKMAQKYGMCPSGFSRKFREAAGMPPLKYSRFLRLQLVRNDLMTTSAPVELIAQKYGFSDSNHLIKLFKRAFFMTPLHFRRQSQDGLSAQTGRHEDF